MSEFDFSAALKRESARRKGYTKQMPEGQGYSLYYQEEAERVEQQAQVAIQLTINRVRAKLAQHPGPSKESADAA